MLEGELADVSAELVRVRVRKQCGIVVCLDVEAIKERAVGEVRGGGRRESRPMQVAVGWVQTTEVW